MVNVLVIGAVAGAALRYRAAPPDGGLGPFAGALSSEDRRAIGAVIRADRPNLRDAMRTERADRAEILAILRAEPFDAAAFGAVTDRITERSRAWIDLGNRLIVDRVAAMSVAERAAFADRLAQKLRRPHDRDRDKDRGRPRD